MSAFFKNRALLVVATLSIGLAADIGTDILGQVAISAAVWIVLLGLLWQVEREQRFALMACLVIATAGELFLSLVWGLYTYRLANVPLFVPPGHVMLLLLGLSLAAYLPESVALAIIGGAGVYSLAAAALGADTLALPLFLVLGLASLAMPAQRRLYASTFVLSLALELYGTWLGNWNWAHDVPGMALVTTNPPGVAGAFYCALDALVAVSVLMLAPRLAVRAAR